MHFTVMTDASCFVSVLSLFFLRCISCPKGNYVDTEKHKCVPCPIGIFFFLCMENNDFFHVLCQII